MPTFYEFAAQLAQRVQARLLQPFAFLIRVSLLSCLGRMLLSLASSPRLHFMLASTLASLQGLNQNLDGAAFAKFLRIGSLNLYLIFLLANILILALFFSAKGGSSGTVGSSGGPSISNFAAHDILVFLHEPANIPSAPSVIDPILPAPTISLPVASAPPLQLASNSAAAHRPSLKDPQLRVSLVDVQAAAVPPRSPARIPHHANDALCSPLETVPKVITKGSSCIREADQPRPEPSASHLKSVQTESQGFSGKRNVVSRRRSKDTQDMRLGKQFADDKLSFSMIHPLSSMHDRHGIKSAPNSPERPPLSPRSPLLQQQHPSLSQNSLFRHKSDVPSSSCDRDANRRSLIRHNSDIQAADTSAAKDDYRYYGQTARSRYYYEYKREDTCSVTRLYTSSALDSLSNNEARKHFSDFTAHQWANVRKQSEADYKASPPPSPLRICS